MFKPSYDQIRIELNRLNEIDYGICYKYHKIIKARILRISKLLNKDSLQFSDMWIMHINNIRRFNDYCSSEFVLPQQY